MNEQRLQDAEKELRAAREELEAERQRYQDLFEYAPAGYVVTDRKGIIEEANRKASELLGVQIDVLAGKPLNSYVAPEDQEMFRALIRQLGEQGRGRHPKVELRLRPREGVAFPASVTVAPVRARGGHEVRMRWMVRDVSQETRARKQIDRLLAEMNAQRRRAEALAADLKQERERLQTIMENTHAQLAYLDADFNFVHVNTAYAEGAGHAKDELIGQNHFDLFPNAENEAVFRQALETGKPVSFRGKPFRYAEQEQRGLTYWDWSLVPVKGDDGEVRGLVFSLLNVTERERLMRQLEGQQARLNAVIENSPEGIVVVDEKARITLTNPAAQEMYRRPVPYGEDYNSHGDLCICYSDGTAYRPRDLPLTRAALVGEKHDDVELILLTPDGERRNLLVSAAPIRDSTGKVSGAVGVFRDITERKHMEAALRDYVNRLQVLHELDQAILVAQSAEDIAETSLTQLRQLLGCPRASVELFDLQAEETSLLAVQAADETRLQPGRHMPLAWSRSLPDLQEGQPHVVEDLSHVPPTPTIEALRQEGIHSFVSHPLQARGELMGALNVGLATVGTPRPKEMAAIEEVAQQLSIGIYQAQLHEALQMYADELEQRVATRTAQLRASEARFRAVFEQSALGIALLDPKGRVISSNKALQDMLETSREDLLGHRLTDFAHPDEDLATDLLVYREMRDGQRENHRVETRYVTPEGKTGWANMVLSLVRGSEGDPQFIIAMVEDITERKRAHEALIQSEKLATTGRLAASLAHEINNPLQTVIGCLGLAEESIEEGEDEVETYIVMAHDELKRAARIVSRLRDLSRPSTRETGEPTDVNEIIDDVLKVSRKDLRNHRIRVHRHLAEDLPKPVLRPDRIKQVFLNLVLNARDAMSEGGELTVTSAHDERTDEVVVTVGDQGAGIPDELMDRLFDPFFSTKDDGSGLGLFVSRNIVQEHGGSVEVESTVGEGTIFTVSLPVSMPSGR